VVASSTSRLSRSAKRANVSPSSDDALSADELGVKLGVYGGSRT
jgi:hypothetical protein